MIEMSVCTITGENEEWGKKSLTRTSAVHSFIG